MLEENKDQKIPPAAVSTIMAKLHQKEIFSEEFLKEWINNGINDVEKLYLFNEERNKKFMELSQDFITYLTQDEED
jgi:phenylalanyl-tRNA synthetase beta subunit